MKKLLRAVLCSCVIALTSQATLANSPIAPASKAAAGQRIAVVDVARVFKAHQQFNQRLEGMKKEAEQFQAMLRGEQEKLSAQAERLKELTPQSPEFRTLETELSKAMTELRVSQSQKGREISEKEAKLYFDTYVEVSQYIANYADQNGISLVIRYSSDPINPENRESVIEGVNREIVFQSGRDITDQIIAMINGPAAGTARRPTAPRNSR